jgi:hypothetical protein
LSTLRFAFVAAACALFALPALADSQVRIVRLSDVQGAVQINKNNGMGFENAFLNLPITQGTQVRTHDRGRAEIEFEDGSTLRLIPDTTVEFSTLGLSDSGQRITVVNLVEGMAYVNWLGKDEFALTFSNEKISIDHAAHFRLDASTEAASLAVFKGEVAVDGSAGKFMIEKKTTATFNAVDDDKYTLAGNITEAPLDSWDRDASAYHDQYARNNSSNNLSPFAYGMSDMNYYGAFSNVPGFGMMWQPFFAGAGWDPFMDGAWSWYPGYGYMFASAYPWGWMPYHYGSWMMIPGNGWMWQPGGFNTWLAAPHVGGTLPANFHPLVAPAAGTLKTVAIGKAESIADAPPTRIAAGSAGLGIPRGSLDNLSHLNHQVAKAGFAEVRMAPPFSTSASKSPEWFAPLSNSTSGTTAHSTSSGHVAGGSHH